MITEDYVSFETAKLLKERGFDWDESPFYSEQDRDEWRQNNNYTISNTSYNPDLPFDSETITLIAPHVSLQMAMKWLREVHKLGVFPTTYYREINRNVKHDYGSTIVRLDTYKVIGNGKNIEDYTFEAETYEETADKAIKYCLENLI